MRKTLMKAVATKLTNEEKHALSKIHLTSAKYIIRYNNPKLLMWDSWIILLALYNSLIIPIEIALEPDQLKGVQFTLIGLIIDLFFILDIIIAFRTTFLN